MINEPTVPATVLIADDSPDVRLLLKRTVEALGLRVVTAGDGEEAIGVAGKENPDAAMLDVQMPRLDGIQVCRRLRAIPQTAAIPIFLVTSELDLSTRLTAFQAGADDYVCKPFEPREVAARLQSRLELAAVRRELAQFEGFRATVRLISHEFNNPLQAIIGGLDLYRLARSGEAVEEGEAIEMITGASDRLVELAHKLLAITEPSFKESPIGSMVDIEASR